MPKTNEKIENWLEKLQQESWNLELLISGFSIFLLIQVGQGIGAVIDFLDAHYHFENTVRNLLFAFLGIIQLASIVLTFNLILHVLLRGFWIGAIGLRSVKGNLDISQLKYSAFFEQKLKGKITGLDTMLIRLDNTSSVIFSFSFLVVFMLISLFLGFSFLLFLGYIIDQLTSLADGTFLESVTQVFEFIILILLLLICLIYIIDTFSLGFFKKYNRISKWYYPIYRLMGWVTLAGVYRAIYYSLITKLPKAQVRLILFIYVMAVSLLPFFEYDQYQFYPDNNMRKLELFSYYYDDLRPEKEIIYRASIPSRTISDQFMPLFIKYSVDFNKDIQKKCPDYKSAKGNGMLSGIEFDDGLNINLPPTRFEENPEEVLACLSSYYNIYLNDSLQANLDFWFFTHPNANEKGIMTTLDLRTAPVGKNMLRITRFSEQKEENKQIIDKEIDWIYIPFWRNGE